MGKKAIAYRVRVGRLHPLHRGVYAVGHNDLSESGRFLGAVRALGAGAVLSHLPAAVLWGFWKEAPGDVDVTVARCLKQRPGIRVHSVRALNPRDTTHHAGIPITTPARTLLDLATDLHSDRALRRTVHEAQVQRRVNQQQLTGQLERATGRQGVARLRAIVDLGYLPTRSELEDRVLDLLQSGGFPKPQTNTRVCGLEVDFLIDDLVIEADGARYHDTPHARQEDARKQALLESAGYRVIRVSWRQVTEEEDQTLMRVQAALRAQRAS